MSEDKEGRLVLSRWQREYEKDEAKAEALEDRMKKSLAAAIKSQQQQVAREFQESSRIDPTGERALEEIKRTMRNISMDDTSWGDEITGLEERPWESDS